MICTATFVGRLTRDPETSTVSKNGEELAVTKFSLAVNHGFGEEAPVSYFDFVAWNGLGTNLAKYRAKGDEIAVIAEPKQSRWTKDGENRNKVEFVARTIEFLRTKGDGANRDAVPAEVLAESAPTSTPAPAPEVEAPTTEAAPVAAPVEEQVEIPF